MKFPSLPCVLLLAGLLASGFRVSANLVVLVDEDFTSGSAAGLTWTSSAAGVSNGQAWTWTSPPADCVPLGTEVWVGTGGASARGLATTYDHDNNPGTPAINIPGGVEVMSSFNAVGANDPDGGLPDSLRTTLSLSLPALLNTSLPGELYFWNANRISGDFGGNALRFELFNVTDNRTIIPSTDVGTGINWTFRSFAPAFLPSDAGDTVELRFSDSIAGGAGGGARGLEFADVNFAVNVVPEPTSVVLLFGGLLALWRLRA